jgi:hypothetical protein
VRLLSLLFNQQHRSLAREHVNIGVFMDGGDVGDLERRTNSVIDVVVKFQFIKELHYNEIIPM